MARHYSRRTFLRQTPRPVLKQYFSRKGLLRQIVALCTGMPPADAGAAPDVPGNAPAPNGDDPARGDDAEAMKTFDAMKKRKGAEKLSDAIEKLPKEIREEVEADFEQVHGLAYTNGIQAILEEAVFRRQVWPETSIDWAARFPEMANHYERAFRVFLEDPDLFNVAGHFDEMDRRGHRQRRIVGKGLVPKVEPEALADLAEAIRAIYKPVSGSRRCTVDNYLRRDPERHCYFGSSG